MWAHLILTSSNGTTTNDSVALYKQEKFQRHKNVRSLRYNSYPAAQPVITERFWFIFFSPDSSRKVLPQKSFAALRDGKSLSMKHAENQHTQFGGTFRGLKQQRRNEACVSTLLRKFLRSRKRIKTGPRYSLPNLQKMDKTRAKALKYKNARTLLER